MEQWCELSFGNIANPLYYGGGFYINNQLVTDLIIPNSVTSIGSRVFEGCGSLTSVTIGNSVTTIGDCAFSDCSGLTHLIVLAETPPLECYSFYGVANSIPVYVPAESLESYASADWGGFTNFLPNSPGDITVSINPSEGGTVTGIGHYEALQTCTLTALANEGYAFAYWTENDSIVSTDMNYSFIVGGGRTLMAHFFSPGEAIAFADANVKAICVAQWDYNGDGELNEGEAALVTDLGTYFKYNDQITSFDELQYFTGVTNIGNQAFSGCSGLVSIEIPNSVTSIGSRVFSGCSGLTSVTIGNSVTTIGDAAFCGCNGLTSIEIPNSVTTIGASAFYLCSGLTSVTIGNSVTTIGASSFCSCGGLTSMEIPNSVTTIGERAFCSCGGLTSVTIGNSVTTIGDDAFYECNGLTSIEIPNSVTTIGASAFSVCSGLASVTIGNSVTTIGDYAFSGCSDLISITSCATTPPTLLGTEVFRYVPSSTIVYVPCGTAETYQAASGWNYFSNYEEICQIIFADATVKALCVANWDTNGDGELSYAEAAAVTDLGEIFKNNTTITSFDELQYFMGLTSIGDDAFLNCISLTTIEIPNYVTSIGSRAFYQCYSLTSIEIPNSVTSIGSHAFYLCGGLTSVTIGNSVTTIGGMAFYHCGGLTSVTIGNSVTTIGDMAFCGCSGLTSIEIPNSVTTISEYAFSHCSGLEQIVVDAGNTVYDSRNNCNAIVETATDILIVGCKNTLIPNSVTTIGDYAFSGRRGLTSIEIPNSVTTIGDAAFAQCNGLVSIEMSNSVTTIGDYAFYNCYSLTSIEIPNSVTTIGDYAFYWCISLALITSYATTPPTLLGTEVFFNVPSSTIVYVPYGTAEAYHATSGWNRFHYKEMYYIIFADDNVKALCVANWDINGDGVLGYDEAAAVTDLNNVFAFNEDIVSFDELQYFTGLSSINDYEFYFCSSLTSISFPSTIVSIGEEAFSGCSSLASITSNPIAPPTLGSGAFDGVPNTVVVHVLSCVTDTYQTTSGWSDFINYEVLDVVGELCPVVFADDNTKALCVTNWDINGDGELSYAEVAAVAGLGEVFRNNTTITSFDELQYFTSLTSIGNYAFDGCSGLVSIEIPNSVTSIGYAAFQGCSGLTSIEIPNSVTTIGDAAFYGCSGLTSVNIPNTVTTIGGGAFANCSGLTSIEIPNSVTSIGYAAFQGCSGLVSIEIPNSVDSIGDYAFWACSGLTSIEIPNSVTSIGYAAFSGCSGLTSIEMPNSVTTIGDRAFYDCGRLTSIEIPNSVTSIGNYAFYGCSGLTSVIIPNSVTTIGDAAFAQCSGLVSIEIPNSVTSIGNNAFSGCSGLVSIISNATTPPTLGPNVYYGVPTTATVYVPCGTAETYQAASGWASFSNYEEMVLDYCAIDFVDANVKATCVAHWDTNGDGELSYAEAAAVTDLGTWFKNNRTITSFDELEYFTGLTSLPNMAFMSCTSLASISLPASLVSLGTGAFFNCSGLTTISVYAETPPSLGGNALGNVPATVTLHVPCGTSGAYQAATGWGNFSNVVEMCTYHFTIPGDWSVANNWAERAVPGMAADVFIDANCWLSTDATVDQLTISSGKMLTVNNGTVLTVSNTLTNNDGSAANLVIADGGQLINPSSGVNGTLKKHITGYGTGDDGWFTIATPIYDGVSFYSLATGSYDLYYYDEPAHYWRNQKNTTNDFFMLNLGQGYLYANMQNMDLPLAGQLNASNAEVSVPVTCEGGVLAGFNLVGNPYTNNISITDVKVNGTTQTAFYRAEGGNNLVAYVAEDNEPIKPGQGFFVKATEGGTLTFGSTPTRGESQPNGNYVRLTLSKDGQVADRAFLCMSDGQTLEKVSLSNAHSQLYFKNGNGRYAVAANEAVNGVMPLCLENAKGTYTIDASLLNVECGYLHLIDNLTGADIDLLETPSYTFEAKPGDDASRFKLVFEAQ